MHHTHRYPGQIQDLQTFDLWVYYTARFSVIKTWVGTWDLFNHLELEDKIYEFYGTIGKLCYH